MINLSSISQISQACPVCQALMRADDWYMPGMRALGHFSCRQCSHEFYGDLPSGHGLLFPMMLDAETGVVYDRFGVPWFAQWLEQSYRSRTRMPLPMTVEEFKPMRRAVIVNCLDTLYGHCLLKLLNSQYYLDQQPDWDVVVIVPKILRWFVPDGVAAIWTVDLPLSRGTEWNDWLAAEIRRRTSAWEECRLSIGFSHPHADDYDIKRFTRVSPFKFEEWAARLEKPTVTFIWRTDRLWNAPANRAELRRRRVLRMVSGRRYARAIKKRLMPGGLPTSREVDSQRDIQKQTCRIVQLAEHLRRWKPHTDFAVAGLGQPTELPSWIKDMRVLRPDDSTEVAWCKRYAESHVVVGIHGSNMLLPSAHAGAVVDLMPDDRWGNIVQDILVREKDARLSLFRNRFLPMSAPVETVANIISCLCMEEPAAHILFGREWCDHNLVDDQSRWSQAWTDYVVNRPIRA